MSMNVFITATREISFKKPDGTKGIDTQTKKFDAYQTPTSVTYEIVNSSDPKRAYIDWVLKTFIDRDEQEPVYAEDDIFCEGEPVRFDVYNPGQEHVREFNEWCKLMEEEGYRINIEVI